MENNLPKLLYSEYLFTLHMHVGQRVRWREWPDYQTGEIIEINRNGVVVMPDDDSEYWPILQPFQLENIEDT